MSIGVDSTSGMAPNLDSASDWAKDGLNTATGEGLVPDNLQSAYTQEATRAELATLAVTLYEIFRGEITGRVTFNDTSDINIQKAAAIGVVRGGVRWQQVYLSKPEGALSTLMPDGGE